MTRSTTRRILAALLAASALVSVSAAAASADTGSSTVQPDARRAQ